MGNSVQPHQQVYDEDAIFRVQSDISVPRCEISDQWIRTDQGERGIGDPTNTSTEGLEEGGETKGEGTEEKGLVQERRFRHGTIHNHRTEN